MTYGCSKAMPKISLEEKSEMGIPITMVAFSIFS
jgi:hypothetical protein